MRKPIPFDVWRREQQATTEELEARAIHTFSNGTEFECWARPNCFACRWWEPEGHAGEHCAMEAAAMLHCVTPVLATLFGWTQRTTEYGPRSGWEPPEVCPFFYARRDDGDYSDDPTPTCPATMSLFADQRTTHDIGAPTMAAPRTSPRARVAPTEEG